MFRITHSLIVAHRRCYLTYESCFIVAWNFVISAGGHRPSAMARVGVRSMQTARAECTCCSLQRPSDVAWHLTMWPALLSGVYYIRI